MPYSAAAWVRGANPSLKSERIFQRSSVFDPAVVEEEGIEGDAAFFVQLVADGVDAVEGVILRVRVEETDVKPAVVMEIGTVGVSAFAFEIGEEGAAHLAERSNAYDGGELGRLVGAERNAAGQLADAPPGDDAALGERRFKAKKEVAGEQRRGSPSTVPATAMPGEWTSIEGDVVKG